MHGFWHPLRIMWLLLWWSPVIACRWLHTINTYKKSLRTYYTCSTTEYFSVVLQQQCSSTWSIPLLIALFWALAVWNPTLLVKRQSLTTVWKRNCRYYNSEKNCSIYVELRALHSHLKYYICPDCFRLNTTHGLVRYLGYAMTTELHTAVRIAVSVCTYAVPLVANHRTDKQKKLHSSSILAEEMIYKCVVSGTPPSLTHLHHKPTSIIAYVRSKIRTVVTGTVLVVWVVWDAHRRVERQEKTSLIGSELISLAYTPGPPPPSPDALRLERAVNG